MTIPPTYKRAVFRAAGGPLVVEEAPLAPPSPNEILVKVEACGVCYSDIYPQNNTMGGGFPIVPGHEIVGRVAALGENVSGWAVGNRIGGAWHGGHDGTCNACRKGWYQMCDAQVINGVTKHGGYAEYCPLNPEAAVRIPDHLSATKYAPSLCAGVTVFNSIRHMNVSPGSTVAIQGLGGLGHLAIQYANKMGFRVVAISRDAEKEAFARELGTHEYIDSSKEKDVGAALRDLGGASLVVSTAPSVEVMKPLLKGLGILGKLLILSVPGELPIDTFTMLKYGASVQVWPSGHASDSEDAIAFTDLHDINCLVEEFPLKDADKAFEAMLKGTVRFRAVITME
ncbi:chaperonin 10-like protein [Aspergillus aurantiobrunneus]